MPEYIADLLRDWAMEVENGTLNLDGLARNMAEFIDQNPLRHQLIEYQGMFDESPIAKAKP